MRTPLLVGIVVLAHVVAVGAVMLIQGCGTTQMAYVPPPPEPTMPPPAVTTTRPASPTAPATATRPTVKAWPSDTTTYAVGKGESLSTIAHRFGLSVREIAALNGIKNPNLIRAGQTLVLPGKVDVKTTKRPAPRRKPAVLTGKDVYVVKAGDCLSVIAARTGTKASAIMEANKLTNDKIYIGQRLKVPGLKSGAVASAPAPAPVIEPELEPVAPAAPVPAVPEEIPEVPAAEPEAAVMMTPAPVAVAVPPAPTPTPTAVRMHTVEEGEDLYSVAMMYGVSVRKLEQLNNLEDTELKPGQSLKIPLDD